MSISLLMAVAVVTCLFPFWWRGCLQQPRHQKGNRPQQPGWETDDVCPGRWCNSAGGLCSLQAVRRYHAVPQDWSARGCGIVRGGAALCALPETRTHHRHGSPATHRKSSHHCLPGHFNPRGRENGLNATKKGRDKLSHASLLLKHW